MNPLQAVRTILAAERTGPVALALIAAALGKRAQMDTALFPGTIHVVPLSDRFGAPFVAVDVTGRRSPQHGGAALAAWDEDGTPRAGFVLCIMKRGSTLYGLPEDRDACHYRPMSEYRVLGTVVGIHDPDGIGFHLETTLSPEEAAEAILALPVGHYISGRLVYHALGKAHLPGERPRFEGTMCIAGDDEILEVDIGDRLPIAPGFVVYGAVRRQDGTAYFGPLLVELMYTEEAGRVVARGGELWAIGDGTCYRLEDVRVVGAVVARSQTIDGRPEGVACASGLDFVDPARPGRTRAEARRRGETLSEVVELEELR